MGTDELKEPGNERRGPRSMEPLLAGLRGAERNRSPARCHRLRGIDPAQVSLAVVVEAASDE